MKVALSMIAICVVTVACAGPDRSPQATDCRVRSERPVGEDTLATESATFSDSVPWPRGKQFEHVVTVVLENQNFDDVMADEYFQQLAQRGTLFTHFFANFRPSYPNYVAMVAGSYLGTSGNEQMTFPVTQRSIADLLESKGLTWRQFAQGYRGQCNTHDGGLLAKYQRKHVPFASFAAITDDPMRCANIVPAGEFDWTRLPNYAFYSPDMCNSGHDLCVAGRPLATSIIDGAKSLLGDSRPQVRQAARWLEGFLAPVFADQTLLRDTLVVITFDEGGDDPDNRVYTVFLGGSVKVGQQVSQCANHYNVLRTIEENFGLGTLGAGDERVEPLAGAFRVAGMP